MPYLDKRQLATAISVFVGLLLLAVYISHPPLQIISGNLFLSSIQSSQKVVQTKVRNLAPVVHSVDPMEAGEGITVTIHGTDLYEAISVSFGGVPAQSIDYWREGGGDFVTAVVGNGASGDIVLETTNGTVTIPGFRYFKKPTVTSFSPQSGKSGTLVTIRGTEFKEVKDVYFGGGSAVSFRVISDTEIEAVVGLGASGTVTVITPGGTHSAGNFQYISSPPPVIHSIEPMHAAAGETVTIRGLNFNPAASSNLVHFGSLSAKVISANSNELRAEVPVGAEYLRVSVTSNNLTAFYQRPFSLKIPGNEPVSKSTFHPHKDLRHISENSNARIIKSVDINNDGVLDLAVTAYGFSFLINRATHGAPTIDMEPTKNIGVEIEDVEFGDFDGDGRKDFIAFDVYDSVFVYRNVSEGNNLEFKRMFSYRIQDQLRHISIADVDLDGKPDIVLTLYFNDEIHFLMNSSEGSNFAFNHLYPIPTLRGPWQTVLADLNGDRKPEMVVAASAAFFGEPTVMVFENQTSGGQVSFGAPSTMISGDATSEIMLADMDGDGKLDIITSNNYDCTILLNISSGTNIRFSEPHKVDVVEDYGVHSAVADIDGDNRPDIVIGKVRNREGKISVFNNKSSSGKLAFERVSFDTYISDTYNFIVGDIDADGRHDIMFQGVNNSPFFSLSALHTFKLLDTIKVCQGANAFIPANKTGQSFIWQVNNGNGYTNTADNANYAGSNSSMLAIKNVPINMDGYKFRCIVDGAEGSPVVLQVNAGSNVTVTISTADTVCDVPLKKFEAKFSSNITDATYFWRVNGIATGTNSSILESSSVKSGDKVQVVALSASSCRPTDSIYSNMITLFLKQPIVPQISIPNEQSNICSGSPAVFNVLTTHEAPGAVFQWKLNSNNVGVNSRSYSSALLKTGDKVQVIMRTKDNCGSEVTVASNVIDIVKNTSRAATISIGGSSVVTKGDSARIFALPVNQGQNYRYVWQDSVSIQGWKTLPRQSARLLLYQPQRTGDKVRCILIVKDACMKDSIVTSSAVSFTLIENEIVVPGVTAFPNPVTSELLVGGIELTDKWQIAEVVTLQGNVAIQKHNIAGQSTVRIRVDALPPGMYLLVLRKTTGEKRQLKFVKR